MAQKVRIAVVTGANRGIGFEVARQLGRKGCHVILAGRNLEKAKAAAEKLRREELDVEARELDVADAKSIRRFCDELERSPGRVDILVNNAGIYPDESGATAFESKVETLREGMETNVYGPFQLCQRIVPLMMRQKYGRVINVSSGMGQLSEMNGGSPAYRLSKTALNAVTRIFSEEASGTPEGQSREYNVQVNSVCPGWVKTDMGGEGADLSVEQGADTIVWLALQSDSGPTGGFFRERERIEW